MVHADRLHRLMQTSEVALDTLGYNIAEIADAKRPGPGEPLKGPSIAPYRTGRAVADAPAEERRLQGCLKPRLGVSICFLGVLWRGKIAKTIDGIGLVETRGFEPLTPCVQSRCFPAELYPTPAPKRRSPWKSSGLSGPRVTLCWQVDEGTQGANRDG